MVTRKTALAVPAPAVGGVPEMQPRLVVRLGRGRTGGTTGLDWMVQRARREGRDPIIADAARNPTLSRLYPGEALTPSSTDVVEVKDWLTSVLDRMLTERRSAVLDLGGGQDSTLAEYVRDLDLLAFCHDVGVLPVAVYFLGPEADDFAHAHAIWREGYFNTPQTLLVLNEGVLKRGQNPAGAFQGIQADPDFIAWVEAGAVPVYMRSLAPLDAMRELLLNFEAAMADRPGRGDGKLGPTRAWQVKSWNAALENEMREVGAWLP
ncbi:hypothetical protein [Teichococcus aestuarii]|uniref:Uncharacterized protein n=1 Tax=Teichococcus aestuarii TaxID=568898 RepID=A0A2U1UYD4_9PROT|nr:hypothetical protein [Pseudoroseomonas aestuarii]PWC26665.1 hypothetical protein CR165_21905 [Pseudoroseomonas aestuarii]